MQKIAGDSTKRRAANGADEYWVGGPGLDFETWVFRPGAICQENQPLRLNGAHS
jgi:hypothetical protein